MGAGGPSAHRADPVPSRSRPCLGHAGYGEVAVYFRLSVRNGHVGDDYRVRVSVEDADAGVAIGDVYHALVDAEWTDARSNIAAIARIDHTVPVHLDLGKCVIDVGATALAARDDRDLGCDRARAAQAIDLQHVGRTHETLEQLVAACGPGLGGLPRENRDPCWCLRTSGHSVFLFVRRD